MAVPPPQKKKRATTIASEFASKRTTRGASTHEPIRRCIGSSELRQPILPCGAARTPSHPTARLSRSIKVPKDLYFGGVPGEKGQKKAQAKGKTQERMGAPSHPGLAVALGLNRKGSKAHGSFSLLIFFRSFAALQTVGLAFWRSSRERSSLCAIC